MWFFKGDNDLYLAQLGAKDQTYVPVGLVCYLSQQCAEIESLLRGTSLSR